MELFNKGYRVWDINEKDFSVSGGIEDKIKFLLNFAVLAPSSHNTEPWKFKIQGNELELSADFSRHLPESDKNKRMIYISLGCAVANTLIAANYFGLKYEVNYLENRAKIIFVSEVANRARTDAHLFKAIKNRRTNRFFYKNIPVASEVSDEFKNLNNFQEIKIDLVADKETKQKIAEIMGEGMKRIMSQKPFRRELADWLRTNLTLKCDGMPGNGHRMNLFTSIIAPHILRNIDVSDVEKDKAIKRVLNFPALGVISSKEDNAINFIHAGEILERLSLAIKSRMMDIAIMVAIIEDPESRAKLQTALKSEFLPQMFFGFGFAEHPAPKSPRRKLNDFLVKNFSFLIFN